MVNKFSVAKEGSKSSSKKTASDKFRQVVKIVDSILKKYEKAGYKKISEWEDSETFCSVGIEAPAEDIDRDGDWTPQTSEGKKLAKELFSLEEEIPSLVEQVDPLSDHSDDSFTLSINLNEAHSDNSINLKGETVVLTGRPPKGYQKKDVAKELKSQGAKVEPNFTKRTTAVVYDPEQTKTKKLRAAQAAGLLTYEYSQVLGITSSKKSKFDPDELNELFKDELEASRD